MLAGASARWRHGICARWLFDGAGLRFKLHPSDGVGFLTTGLSNQSPTEEQTTHAHHTAFLALRGRRASWS